MKNGPGYDALEEKKEIAASRESSPISRVSSGLIQIKQPSSKLFKNNNDDQLGPKIKFKPSLEVLGNMIIQAAGFK